MSDRVRRGKTRPRCANETSIPAQQDDPGNRGGCQGLFHRMGSWGLGGTATPIQSAWVTPGPVRRSVFGQPHLHGHPRTTMPFRRVGTPGKGRGAGGREPLHPSPLFCYPTRRHEILAGSTTGPCIWMMPWCGRLRIFFLPFKGAQFARTLAQSIDATELSVLRPGAPVPRPVCFNMRFHASTRVGAICFRYCAPTHCLGFSRN